MVSEWLFLKKNITLYPNRGMMKMKRLIVLSLIIGLLAVSSVDGGARRIVRHGGQITDTLVAADSETHLSGKISILNASGNLNFDELVIGFSIPNMTEITSMSGEGLVDSVIIRLLMGTGANVDTVATMTKGSLPATFTMRVSALDFLAFDSTYTFRDVTDTSTSGGDSITVGYNKIYPDSTSVGFYHDLFWFSAYVVDTAGSSAGDSLQYTITWWAKFIERRD